MRSIVRLPKTLALIAGAALAFAAAPSFAGAGKAGHACGAHHHSAGGKHGDHALHMGERLARLKTDLKLQPSQDGAWQAYASTVTGQAEKMQALHAQAKTAEAQSLPERLDRRAEFMKQRQADLEERNAALKTLYAALTAEQRAVLEERFTRRKRHT